MESHGQFSDFNTFDRQQNGIFQSQNGPQMPSQIPMNQIQYQQQMYQNSIYDPQNMYQEDPDIYQQQQQQMEGVGSNYSQYSQQDFLIQNQQNQFFPEESYEMPQYSQYDMQIPSQISYNSQIPSTSPNQFNQFQYPEQNIQQHKSPWQFVIDYLSTPPKAISETAKVFIKPKKISRNLELFRVLIIFNKN